MNKKKNETDILIIGGGPAGIIVAITARSNNSDKQITLIRNKKTNIVPCGIPYIFNRLDSVEKNIMPDKALDKNNIDLIIDEAMEINEKEKKVALKGGQAIYYDKLVLATGSQPNILPIEGLDKKGVFVINKDFDYLKNLRSEALKSRNIVIIGGGFIGAELAEEMSNIKDKNISIIEKNNYCLGVAFDREFAQAAEERLIKKDIKIYNKSTLESIGGNDKVEYVILSDGRKIVTDLLILSVGSKPDVGLAQKTGIKAGRNGIQVNKYMQTNTEDIFAVGDCAETKDLCAGVCMPVMLASTACYEARIAGANLYDLKKENRGTLGSFSTFIDDLVLGAVGLTEEKAIKENIEILKGKSESTNHHPGTLPNTEKINVKLIYNKGNKKIIGGQVMGPESIAEMINIIALAIQKEATVDNFLMMQFATHPLLTSAPTVYTLIEAAKSALSK